MQNQPENDINDDDDSLKNLFIFQDIFAFARDHTGLLFTIAYLTLILSSMTYLHVLYSAFDISIVKFISLEDILATPIKNPDIILVFIAILIVLFFSELGNRWNVRMTEKYQNKKRPLFVRIIRIMVWVPKSRKINIRFTIMTSILFLAMYVMMFAKFEAQSIKEGRGARYQITVADTEQTKEQTLLGTTSQFVFIYDLKTEESGIYHVENILKMKPVVDLKPQAIEAPVEPKNKIEAEVTPKPQKQEG